MKNKRLHVAPGTLLLSVPQMRDPNFMHTVVLMCDHTPEGAFGVVVNRAAELTVGELFPEHPVLSDSKLPVGSGGPVGRDTLQILHRLPDDLPGSLQLEPGLFLGGELDALGRLIEAKHDLAGQLKLVLGYSGWGAEQLDAELEVGSWLPAPVDLELVFGAHSEEAAWRRALQGLGREGEGLSHFPPDVSWN